ncbi:MAG: hypothetical protein P9L96_03190 [Candidatus Gygaella obscura]|nr:hypothetical protein [Candidatus Gygaella obscura]
MKKESLIVLFSGGVDSTYTAMKMADIYKTLHCLTYERFGFINASNSEKSFQQVSENNKDIKAVHKIINIDNFVKKVSYSNYLINLCKYGFVVLSNCLICKLAMHWRTIIYCRENNLKEVCDGANKEMYGDPSQNKVILEKIVKLYEYFNIRYFSPFFDELRKEREDYLFAVEIIPVQYAKWSRFSRERQPFCCQEHLSVLFKRFRENILNQYSNLNMKNIEKDICEYCDEKISCIKNEIERN